FVLTADGVIATNYHLIRGASAIIIKFHDGRVFDKADVLDFNSKKDLALIKITASSLKPVVLGDSDRITIGQRVVTIGNPMGLESSIADGLISAVRMLDNKIKVFQISVPLSQGSSGGPLFDLNGEVVGITTMAYVGGQDLNFAMPVSYLKRMLIGTPYAARQNFMPAYATDKQAVSPALLPEKKYILYSVRPHDTLFGLSRKFSTSVSEIQALNKLKTPVIYVKHRIKIPQSD
ncbi:MAG: trypsin-like peptidase domain-containing protein, partial [Candidatus Omnitrophica bacterium]|nr:trypsin-like peptidase domain-containing protein [Candidatus Omnitrophota bacterium]